MKRIVHKKLLSSALAVICLGGGSTAVLGDEDEFLLEEIIVTATKRSESVQDVAGSISVISAETLQNQGISDFEEVFQSVANVSYESPSQQSPAISVRGVNNIGNGVGFEPAVTVYIDEVPRLRPSAYGSAIYDLERIEVLRGPQGTLFGKNTVGGLFSVTTQKPTEETQINAELSLGSRDLIQARASVAGELVEGSLSGRLAMVYKEQDGWLENRNGEDLFGQEYSAVRGHLLQQVNEDIRLLYTAEYSDFEGTGDQTQDVDGDSMDRSVSVGPRNSSVRDSSLVSIRADIDFEALTLTSLSAYQAFESTAFYDQDFSPAEGIVTMFTEDVSAFTQEVRLTSNYEGRVNFIAGFFYLHEEVENPVDFWFGDDFGDPSGTSVTEIETDSLALFGTMNVDVTDTLELALGLRYTEEEKDFDLDATFVEVFPPGQISSTEDLSEERWSGDITLNYRPNNDWLIYAKYAHGFKAGGFANISALTGGAPIATAFGQSTLDLSDFLFDSELMDNYEIGFKSDIGDRVRFNGSVFMMDYTDKQEQIQGDAVIGGVTLPVTTIANAGEAEIKGVELELVALATEWLRLEAALGYLDTEFTEFDDPLGGTSLEGNQLARAPEWSGSLAAQFNFAVSDGLDGMMRIDANYKGDNYIGQTNTLEQESHTIANIRAGVEATDGRWAVYLWGRNVTDETVYQFPNLVNAPESYGMDLRVNF
ncbi:TonB-dependent receptor [Pseudomaricurvus alkylphenolicus]|uniref:TonB-dependent receptor n=1 Tax=Pseudomaricurvus alkylphenolicus TaxID=1306991 RepID=UPI0014227D04|nr:TonB-dependent receptor [Pseudomaricurvus alkylphenolicus]NIB40617.1 TonB-dependent receptor [Pseudomaricurvus alkylphenolicus]